MRAAQHVSSSRQARQLPDGLLHLQRLAFIAACSPCTPYISLALYSSLLDNRFVLTFPSSSQAPLQQAEAVIDLTSYTAEDAAGNLFPATKQKQKQAMPVLIQPDEAAQLSAAAPEPQCPICMDPMKAMACGPCGWDHDILLSHRCGLDRKSPMQYSDLQVLIDLECTGNCLLQRSFPCRHVFCDTCIRAAVKAQKKCPTCRKTMAMKAIHRVYLDRR